MLFSEAFDYFYAVAFVFDDTIALHIANDAFQFVDVHSPEYGL